MTWVIPQLFPPLVLKRSKLRTYNFEQKSMGKDFCTLTPSNLRQRRRIRIKKRIENSTKTCKYYYCTSWIQRPNLLTEG